MSDGHRFLSQNFNVTPTIGWSIDPFGSSGPLCPGEGKLQLHPQTPDRDSPTSSRFTASNAALYAMMGFDALVINRIPSEVMDTAKATKGACRRTAGPRGFATLLSPFLC